MFLESSVCQTLCWASGEERMRGLTLLLRRNVAFSPQESPSLLGLAPRASSSWEDQSPHVAPVFSLTRNTFSARKMGPELPTLGLVVVPAYRALAYRYQVQVLTKHLAWLSFLSATGEVGVAGSLSHTRNPGWRA